MKKLGFILGGVVLASCGAPEQSVGTMEELKAQKDSLVEVRSTVMQKLLLLMQNWKQWTPLSVTIA